MERKFEVIVDKNIKGKDGASSNVVTEKVVLIEEKETSGFIPVAIEGLILKYIENTEKRNKAEAKENITRINNKEKAERRTLRTPEASLQNSLLRIFHQRDVPIEQISHWIKVSLAKHLKENSIGIQEQIDTILRGVEKCNEAVNFLEKSLREKHKDESILIATNDQFDARYKIDLLAMVEDKDGHVKVLNLVQVKSSKKEEEIINIMEDHQKYLDALPQLIGILNKKEAATSVEKEANKEIIDIDRNIENKNQLTLFGLVLDEYINNIDDAKKINATDFYNLFKKEGGILNPFTVMGIFKNAKVLDGYRKDNYFHGDKKREEYLSKTAGEIPFTEIESITFHKNNHVHSIVDSAQIFSIVMIGGEKVSEKELKHPYNK